MLTFERARFRGMHQGVHALASRSVCHLDECITGARMSRRRARIHDVSTPPRRVHP